MLAGILNAEGLNNVDRYSAKRFFSPGFARNFVLLMWSVTGSLLAMAFLSTIRTMLLSPKYEKPIESTMDVVSYGKIPILGSKNGLWPAFLRTSSNPWEQIAGDIGITYDTHNDARELMKKVHTMGTHSILQTFGLTAYQIITDPWYSEKAPPYFQTSRKPIKPYCHGWIYPKNSKWKKDVDRHILLLQQVGYIIYDGL